MVSEAATLDSINFVGISKSLRVELNGRTIRFPSRHDYLAYLLYNNIVTNELELINRRDLVQAVYRHWQSQGPLGCRFAQFMSHNPSHHGIRTLVIPGPISDRISSQILSNIAFIAEDSLKNPEVEALSVLIPGLVQAKSLSFTL